MQLASLFIVKIWKTAFGSVSTLDKQLRVLEGRWLPFPRSWTFRVFRREVHMLCQVSIIVSAKTNVSDRSRYGVRGQAECCFKEGRHYSLHCPDFSTARAAVSQKASG